MLALRSHCPEEVSTGVGRRVAVTRVVSCSGAGQLLLPDPRSLVLWHQARRDPTGLSPERLSLARLAVSTLGMICLGRISIYTMTAFSPEKQRGTIFDY